MSTMHNMFKKILKIKTNSQDINEETGLITEQEVELDKLERVRLEKEIKYRDELKLKQQIKVESYRDELVSLLLEFEKRMGTVQNKMSKQGLEDLANLYMKYDYFGMIPVGFYNKSRVTTNFLSKTKSNGYELDLCENISKNLEDVIDGKGNIEFKEEDFEEREVNNLNLISTLRAVGYKSDKVFIQFNRLNILEDKGSFENYYKNIEEIKNIKIKKGSTVRNTNNNKFVVISNELPILYLQTNLQTYTWTWSGSEEDRQKESIVNGFTLYYKNLLKILVLNNVNTVDIYKLYSVTNKLGLIYDNLYKNDEETYKVVGLFLSKYSDSIKLMSTTLKEVYKNKSKNYETLNLIDLISVMYKDLQDISTEVKTARYTKSIDDNIETLIGVHKEELASALTKSEVEEELENLDLTKAELIKTEMKGYELKHYEDAYYSLKNKAKDTENVEVL